MNLRPCDFWALTPDEWRWLTAEAAAPDRAAVEALAALYPDREDER